jgi:hypothetical protein
MDVSRYPTLETVDFRNREEVNRFPEQIMAEGLVKARAENAELISRGQMDAADNLAVTERPAEYLLLRGRLVPGRVHFSGRGNSQIESSMPMAAPGGL